MKKLLIGAIVLLIAVVMVKTVPEKKAHKEAMMEAVKGFVDDQAEERGLGDNVITNLGKGIVNKTIETALNSKLQMNDYYLFNTTSVRLQGEDQLLSFGILGYVFTFDKKMLREKLEESMHAKQEATSEREAAKENAKELKKLEKEKRKREKALEKERKRQEKEAQKEQKRKEKEEKKKKQEQERNNE